MTGQDIAMLSLIWSGIGTVICMAVGIALENDTILWLAGACLCLFLLSMGGVMTALVLW